jgi:hypothetical protein
MIKTPSDIKAKAEQLAKLWTNRENAAERAKAMNELDEMPPYVALDVAIDTYRILRDQCDDEPASLLFAALLKFETRRQASA